MVQSFEHIKKSIRLLFLLSMSCLCHLIRELLWEGKIADSYIVQQLMTVVGQ